MPMRGADGADASKFSVAMMFFEALLNIERSSITRTRRRTRTVTSAGEPCSRRRGRLGGGGGCREAGDQTAAARFHRAAPEPSYTDHYQYERTLHIRNVGGEIRVIPVALLRHSLLQSAPIHEAAGGDP